MSYTARKLIQRAYSLSEIVSQDLQTVSGAQESVGLQLLNDVLTFKSTDERLIPYWTRFTFPTVAGQEEYFIENLLAVNPLTFNLQDVRFSTQNQSRIQYFGQSRVNNIQSLPFTWHLERELGGSRIYLYFVPDQVYQIQFSGKFAFTEVVSLDTDLALTYDRYYIEYLRYALADMICDEYSITTPDNVFKKLAIYEKKVMDVSPPDLSIQTVDYFGSANAVNWAIVNLSRGYLPG